MTLPSQVVPFAEWLPDLPAFANPGSPNVRNALPGLTSYKPAKALVEFSGALTARCQGAIAVLDSNGTPKVFAGDATKLYKLSSTTWNDVSRVAGGAYATGSSAFWRFTDYDPYVIATNLTDDIQYIDKTSGTNFAQLSASAPKAKHIATIREFVMVGWTTADPNKVQWCSRNNATSWSGDEANEQELLDGGPVRALVGGAYGLIFQQKDIKRALRVRAPITFQIESIQPGLGLMADQSVVQDGSTVYWWDWDGLYAFDGSSVLPIGAEKINRTIMANINRSYMDRIVGAADPINHYIVWIYPSTNSAGTPDKALVINTETKKWGNFEVNAEYLYSAMQAGWTLEQIGAAYPQLESVPFSLDSDVWKGGALLLGAFSTAHKLGYFTGSNLEADLETRDFVLPNGKRVFVADVLPITDAASMTVEIGWRERLGDAVAYDTAASLETRGLVSVRKSGRYVRALQTTGAGITWNDAVGIEFFHKPAGNK